MRGGRNSPGVCVGAGLVDAMGKKEWEGVGRILPFRKNKKGGVGGKRGEWECTSQEKDWMGTESRNVCNVYGGGWGSDRRDRRRKLRYGLGEKGDGGSGG